MPKCPKKCSKPDCVLFRKTVIPSVAGNDDIIPPENGDFCNMLVVYEATGNAYIFDSAGVPTLLSTTDYARLSNLPTINGEIVLGDMTLADLGITQLVEAEAKERKTSDDILQRQVDALAVASDVVDIVGTHEELEEYDTSKLKENDIVKVLADETVGGATTYYRWVDSQWGYIGQEGPYYTKSETDALLEQKMDVTGLDDYYTKSETNTLLADKADLTDLANKQDTLVAGNNITIDSLTNIISAVVPSLENYYTKQDTYSQTEVNGLISGVEAEIPTNTSDLVNNSGFLTAIPVATSSVLGGIKVGSGLSVMEDGTLSASGTSITVDSALSTSSENPVQNKVITTALNGKANTTDIPTVPTSVSAFYNDAGYITSTTLAQNYYNKTETYSKTEINNAIPTKTSELTNNGSDNTSTYVETDELATVATSGSYSDLLNKPTIPEEMVVLSYGRSTWNDFITAYNDNRVVYCRASSNSNPGTGTQGRMAFMAYINNPDSPTSVEFQYVRSVATKTISQQCDQVFVYTLASTNGGTWSVQTREMAAEIVAGTNMTSSYSSGTLTLNATQPTVPTKTSNLANDGSDGTSTYVEADELATVATTGAYSDLTGTPTIPTATSDLNNDSGFLTATDYASANTGGVVKVGSNLSIDVNGVLSATDTTYSAGTNITIASDTISTTAAKVTFREWS